MRIDLHVHSTASDGAFSPAEVVERAVGGGLGLISVADHDTVAGVAEAQRAADERLTIVPAIEISAIHRGRDLHILGYGIDVTAPAVQEYQTRARVGREARIRHMIERLSSLDVAVEFDAVAAEAGPGAPLARPHLARVLHADGHVDSIGEAFDRYIGDEGPAFVPTDLLDVPGAIELIHRTGGIAVWAHPPLPLLGSALRSFVEAGLDGLEVYRPRLSKQDTNRVRNKARKLGLLMTGGSDWHGEWHGDLGDFHLLAHQLDPFLERLGIPRD